MYTLKYRQKLPITLEESWSFFSSPTNLGVITPKHLNFQIANASELQKMYAGQIIAYKIRPVLNLTMDWVSEITHVEEPYYFIDEQRLGPYKLWHHEHRFIPIFGGVEMLDTIYYQLPLGFFGNILHTLKIRSDLEHIFAFRRAKLEELFGSYKTRE